MLAGLSAVGFTGVPRASRSIENDSTLTGEWRGETYADGTTAQFTLNLFPNGTYSRKVVTVSEFGWTLQGDMLMLAPAVANEEGQLTYGKASVVRLHFTGDSLIATAGKESLTLRRVTALVEDLPLLGRWEGQSDLNEGLTQDFTADGRLIVSVAVSREAGYYTVSDGVISFAEQIPQPGRKRTRFRLEDGKMLLFIAPELPPIELTRAPRVSPVS